MKKFSQQLHKKATATVTLQAAERRELRERLVSYMEYHPLPAELQVKTTVKAKNNLTQNEPYTVVKVPFFPLFKYSFVAVAVVLLVVPFVAERAVPGDTLYAVKVQFNEELRSKLTFGGYQRIEWETERLNRRIAEARLLASEGRLTEAVEMQMAQAVKAHTQNAKREIDTLRSEDADAATIASITLDTTLEAQANSLMSRGGGTEEAPMLTAVRPTDLIASAINESREMAREKATSSIPAYDRLLARVELNTTRMYELRTVVSRLITAEQLTEVTRRIEDVERSVAQAIAQAEVDETLARETLVGAMQRSQKIIVFMAQLQMNQAIDIESLVPVVLTAEEEQVYMTDTVAVLAAKLQKIEQGLVKVEDESLREKVSFAYATIADTLELMSASTTDYQAFTMYARDMQALADDAILLLGQINEQVDVVPEKIIASTTATTSDAVTEDGGVATDNDEEAKNSDSEVTN
jgi:hypothetical protein